MMRAFDQFRKDEGGGPAIEFGLVIPIVVAMLMLGVDGWLRMSHVQNAASALHAGARYYQQGGTEDDDAVAVTLAAWAHAPDDAEISITRESSGSPEQTFVTIKATSTFTGLKGSEPMTEQEVVRVQ
jgi:Flp pilus assembly protein TadG